MLPQDPIAPAVTANPTSEIVQQLQALGWIDHTAIAVVLVFLVLGFFKGLIWQVSRIAILVVAYVVAGRFGHNVAELLGSGPSERVAQDAMQDPGLAPGELTLYLAYVLLFLVVLVVLSLLTMLIKKLADKAGLSFFDRLGGGVLGVATGACVVLAMVFLVNMFFPESQLAEAARSSHSLRYSQRAIDLLGSAVNDDLRSLLRLQPLEPRDGTPQPGEQPPAGQPGTGQPGSGQPGAEQPAGGGAGQPRKMIPGAIPVPASTTPGTGVPAETPPGQPGGGGGR